MTASNGINYRETHFELKDLTPIRGEPTAETLLNLTNELKANARSVNSHLGGGNHGHLGLILSPADYAHLSNVAFQRPIHPGILTIPPNTTQHMSNTLRETHKEALRLFNEVLGVEKALLQQIIAAVEPHYLSAIRNRTTNSITIPLYDVLQYLKRTYGRVTPQMLSDKTTQVTQMVYNLQLPIDAIFNAIDDLADFATLAECPIQDGQLVHYGYLILLRTGRFNESIREWNRRTANLKTWDRFKTFFRQAHQELRETTNLTLEAAELQAQQANLVQQVILGVQDVITQQTPAPAPPPETPPPPPQ